MARKEGSTQSEERQYHTQRYPEQVKCFERSRATFQRIFIQPENHIIVKDKSTIVTSFDHGLRISFHFFCWTE